jgi:hypothetical protein
MNGPSSVSLTLAGVAAFQAILTPWLNRISIADEAYRKMVLDRIKNYPALTIEPFFKNKTRGSARVDVIIGITTLASRVVSQLFALITALIAVAVLLFIAWDHNQAPVWKVTTLLATLLAVGSLGFLATKIGKGELRKSRIKRTGWTDVLSTPAPYTVVVVLLAIFVAVAGLYIG